MTSMQVVGCTPPTAYMPNTIVQVPRPVTDYARFMTDAPSVALAPARKDCTEEQPLQSSRRHRTRLQVGNTNRWRLPQSLLSDLLGMSQATRAVQYNSVKPFNSSYIKIFSGEGRHSYMNEDMNKEISLVTCKKNLPEEGAPAFSQSSLRPSWQGSRANSSRSDIRSVQSAPVKLSVSRSAPSYSRMTEYVPERARPSSTKDLFYYHTRLSPQTNAATPDVLLRCMDMDFELHSLVLKRSPVLSSLLEETMGSTPVDMSYYKSSVNKTLDGLISSSELNYRNSQSNDEHAYKRSDRPGKKAITHAAHVSEHMRKKVATIKWDLEDNSVSRHAMAIALGNLYHSSYQVHNTDLASVLLAADKLQYSQLVNYCVDEIISCISYSNVASFYDAGIKTEQVRVVDACIRWLELNLISVVMNKIQLRDIPIKLLETVLKSSKLFTYSEYHLYTCLSLWLFLRLNPHIQLMPASTNVITYFNR
ncbi:BTBD16 [Bugula neritina]|uniref:BTBD16 n=1 Tax=Bugula neritina TaxID=10212 RepID=A0A7J7KRA4_BUGNE|nr:BTBD16 [Bugula neritina]